jgi:hypothetical protein
MLSATIMMTVPPIIVVNLADVTLNL